MVRTSFCGWHTLPACAQSMVDSLTGDHFIGKLSTVGQPTKPTWPSVPPGLVNE